MVQNEERENTGRNKREIMYLNREEAEGKSNLQVTAASETGSRSGCFLFGSITAIILDGLTRAIL